LVVTATEVHRAIEAVFRIEQARLIAGLARIVRDVGQAEELAQDALVVALERWPETGVPDNPGAWLMQAAKRRAIDRLRPRPDAGAQAPAARPRAAGRAGTSRSGDRVGAGRRRGGRPAAARVHRLPSGAVDRRPRRAHPASLTRNTRERTLLLERAAACSRQD
jgi:hypothetical protein